MRHMLVMDHHIDLILPLTTIWPDMYAEMSQRRPRRLAYAQKLVHSGS